MNIIYSVIHKIKHELFLLKHKGGKYCCPFCGYSSDLMWPLGADNEATRKYKIVGGGRRNYMRCIKCGSSDRERLIYLYLKDYVHAFEGKGKTVLHIAPEPHIASVFREESSCRYFAGDSFAEGYQYPNYVQNMNVLNLPFDSDQFDIVICNHVLEHVPNDKQAMSELQRVLRPSGIALLQVPISYELEHTIEDPNIQDPAQKERLFGQRDHCRLYGNDYVTRLTESGFVVNKVILSEKYNRYAINPEEKLFVCTK